MAARKLTPAYRGVMIGFSPVVRLWGRLKASGLEHLPPEGPVLLAGNHDSYWDPIAIGMAAQPVRQIHALAKAELWEHPLLDKILDGMGQIPIQRGKSDANAMARAIEGLRGGICIGIFPEGTRSRGQELRARGGLGRLALEVPEAEIVCCSVVGTTDVIGFPTRPSIRVRFFRPEGGGIQPGESPADLGARLLREIRAEAPVTPPARGGKPKKS